MTDLGDSFSLRSYPVSQYPLLASTSHQMKNPSSPTPTSQLPIPNHDGDPGNHCSDPADHECVEFLSERDRRVRGGISDASKEKWRLSPSPLSFSRPPLPHRAAARRTLLIPILLQSILLARAPWCGISTTTRAGRLTARPAVILASLASRKRKGWTTPA